MPGTALALVIAAALIHAGWNLWMKRAGVAGGMVFVWGTVLVSAIAFTPLAGLAGAPRLLAEWGAGVWLAVAVSALVHTLYFRVLQRGYGAGDLSVVYPVARGTGPLLASLAAIVMLGETAGLAALAGLALVVAGTFTIAGGLAVLRAGADAAVRRGLLWGLATGILIATYTVNDGRAVAHLDADPLVYYWTICVVQAVLLGPWIIATTPGWRRILGRSWRVVVGVGVLSPLSYLLVLEAMRLAPISVVAPARELSMLAAALAGTLLLREGQAGRRVAGAVLIAIGVALLASG